MKPWWAVCQSQCELLDHFPPALLTSICDWISTGVYLWLNLTLEIVIDWMVLLCPCIYCTVDKNSKLEVSSGLYFFLNLELFIWLENISTSVFCWGESLLKFHFKSFQASIYWQPWKPFRTSSQTPTITFACFIKAQIWCNSNSESLPLPPQTKFTHKG